MADLRHRAAVERRKSLICENGMVEGDVPVSRPGSAGSSGMIKFLFVRLSSNFKMKFLFVS